MPGMLRTFLAIVPSFLATFVFGIFGMALAIVARGYVIRLSVRPWAKTVLKCCRVNLKVEGVENIPPEPSVIMYNHQSSFDIPAILAALPVEYKMVMKDEVLRIPFVGWVSKMAGHYFVSRDGGSGDSGKLKLMTRGIREKNHTILLAPEGTRSESGRLLDFKKGGFLLASVSGAPVVPVVIWGGKNVKKKGSFQLRTGGKMSVKFFPPVSPRDFPAGREGMEGIEQKVRSVMLHEVEKNLRSEESAEAKENL